MNKNYDKSVFTYVMNIKENITRVVHTLKKEIPGYSILIDEEFIKGLKSDSSDNEYIDSTENIEFKNNDGEVILKEVDCSFKEKDIYSYVPSENTEEKSEHTANGDVSHINGLKKQLSGKGYGAQITFEIDKNEGIYGLGQHENGIYNYNGQKEYLFQANKKISIPFLISSKNYGILIDTETAMIFDSANGTMKFTLDTVKDISYYVITGKNFDEIINTLRNMTGKTPMLPRWAFGYMQSKEKYSSSDELINISKKFREKHIPIDCIVQDWCTWPDGLWGEKKPDKSRYPDVKELTQELHDNNVRLMVSIWPNMAPGGSNLKEFKEKNLSLPNTNNYNAYNSEARQLYWKQCNEEWFSGGVDAWWCDNSEPFDADWNGEKKRSEEERYKLNVEEDKKHIDWTRLNSYGLMHSKGIYENWRKSNSNKRVVNLTRSSYISGQRYGAICWSGDTSAKWDTLKKQIVEGLKFSVSGMPYWTLDIGGFFTVKDKYENRGCGNSSNHNPIWFWDGDYNEGVNDLGYRELYTRWLQYGTFLPVFRSHGTDTPREPWNFGKPGDIFYDSIIKFINLRYKLIPYIYSCAAETSRNNINMLRSLMFDFAEDENVLNICDSFMFGKCFLVSPVTKAMYYGPESAPIKDSYKIKNVYLPKGAQWYDFWTNELYEGGQTVESIADINTMPIFVKSGSIVPLSEPLSYADEKGGHVSEIIVYDGQDGEFNLYNDEGDNYSYEKGNYSVIHIKYNEKSKTLVFGDAEGNFEYQKQFKIKFIMNKDKFENIDFKYEGKEAEVRLIKE